MEKRNANEHLGRPCNSAQEEIAQLFTAVLVRRPTRNLETKHTRPLCPWLAFARALVSTRWTVAEKECMEQDLGVGSLGQNASWSRPQIEEKTHAWLVIYQRHDDLASSVGSA